MTLGSLLHAARPLTLGLHAEPSTRKMMAIESGSSRRASTGYAPPLVSWEAFHDWVIGSENRAEWVDGEIIKLMPDNLEHFLLMDFVCDLIKSHVRRQALGLVFFANFLMRLETRPSGRVPDIFFVANEHLDRLTGTNLNGPADLVVEIVSPDSETRDRREKFLEYQAAKIPEYWLLDQPRREAYFYVLDAEGRYQLRTVGDDGIYTSTVLPGFRLRVEWLWRSPLPLVEEALAELLG